MASRKPAKPAARQPRVAPPPPQREKPKLALVPSAPHPTPNPSPPRGGVPRFVAGHPAPSRHAIQAARRGFTRHSIDYDQTDEVDPYLAADLALTKRIAEKLEAHYPAHPWMVTVTHAQGIAAIKLPLVMKRNQAFILHIDKLGNDPSLRAVVRAGGELLEKYNMPRHGFALDRFLQARDKGPYGPKPRPKLWLPEFASSVRPRLLAP